MLEMGSWLHLGVALLGRAVFGNKNQEEGLRFAAAEIDREG